VWLTGLLVAAALGTPPDEAAALPGRWYPNAHHAHEAEIARLEALGYLGGYAPGDGAGVRVWDRDRATPGVNLYSSGHAATALLVGMDGRVLHRWALPFAEAFPDLHVASARATGAWRRVALRPEDGHLLAIHEGVGLVHLDARSRVVWATANRAHHEARWLPSGGVLVLTRILRLTGPGGRPLLEDHVAELDPRGREVRRVSVLAALSASRWRSLLDGAPVDPGDPLHTNALFPLDGDRVLLSLRHVDALVVLDLAQERIVWAGTGPWVRQHDAEIAPSGAMMLFDNRGGPGGTSRALAIEPFGRRITWSYGGPPGRPLSSDVLGAVQELPTGNVLITESTRGRAVEVTREGDVVWMYDNPEVTGPDGAYVAAIFEMVRLPLSQPLPWALPPAP
jgi:hypothetical protein